jgi:hypothetical protein
MSTTRTHRLAVAAAISALAIALTGCVAETPMPTPTSTPSPSASSEPEAPTAILRPGESAAANAQYFDLVNGEFYTRNGRSNSRSIVDHLVAAGFEKVDLEITADTTPTGRAADSIVFSVRIEGECLIGQFGPNGYTSSIESLLGTGSCLVGQTLPIDW